MIPNDTGSHSAAEQIAYKLLQHIAAVERRAFFHNPGDESSTADRQWILDTYAECLNTVRNSRVRRG